MRIDIDECAEGIVKVGNKTEIEIKLEEQSDGSGSADSVAWCHQVCNNTIGAYICDCLDGYDLDFDDNSTCTGNELCICMSDIILLPVNILLTFPSGVSIMHYLSSAIYFVYYSRPMQCHVYNNYRLYKLHHAFDIRLPYIIIMMLPSSTVYL